MHVLGLVGPANAEDCRMAAGSASATITFLRTWGDVVSQVGGPTMPAALIVDGERMSESGASVLVGLHRRGLLVPTQLYLPLRNHVALKAVWDFPRDSIIPAFTPIELREALANVERAELRVAIARYLIRRLSAVGVVESFLLLLARRKDITLWPIHDIAAELRMSRRVLYREFRTQNAPSPEKVQTIFRLVHAARVMQSGGSAIDAAYRSGYSDESSLRKALRDRFGVTLRDVRACSDWRLILDRWLVSWDLARDG